ncbi:hypothetical protein LEN26_020283 [Aphanomyces euteiches]|nr:hypothetical protein LEN26_020283 [Aphanomyces euteiches]KAH9110157.1 hypothetical protein AeMF1_014960 [Aphanomyces euteiches]KAH9184132.1 hypothetical protein AeNC1_013890 [Aphanomyces euteiches]
MDLLIATETMALEEALAAEVDLEVMFMDDLDLFDSSNTSPSAAKVLSASTTSEVLSDIASSDSSVHSPPAPTDTGIGSNDIGQKKKVNVTRKRQREELEHLRSKVNELEEHLKVVQQVKALEDTSAPTWQKRADQARIAKQIALNENEKLKHELEEQIEFGKALQVLLKKRPKLTMLPTLESEEWRVFKLVKDPTLRYQAVNMIYQQQYQLTDVAMIESGILDKSDSYELVTPRIAKNTGDLMLQGAYRVTLSYDFNVVSDLVWLLTHCGLEPKTSGMSYTTLEKFDFDAAYISFKKKFNSLPYQSNNLFKRCREPTRDVIIGRSVLEDELYPFEEGSLIMNKSFWLVLDKVNDGKGCRISHFHKCMLPMVQSKSPATYNGQPVGALSDYALESLKTNLKAFTASMNTLLSEYSGNASDSFFRVRARIE